MASHGENETGRNRFRIRAFLGRSGQSSLMRKSGPKQNQIFSGNEWFESFISCDYFVKYFIFDEIILSIPQDHPNIQSNGIPQTHDELTYIQHFNYANPYFWTVVFA